MARQHEKRRKQFSQSRKKNRETKKRKEEGEDGLNFDKFVGLGGTVAREGSR